MSGPASAEAPAIVWFRRDLRLADNPALRAAAESGRALVPLFILDEETPGLRGLGGAARWWLHHALAALDGALGDRGARLLLKRGAAAEVLPAVVEETGATAVYWNRCYEPAAVACDRCLKAELRAAGLAVESFNAGLLFEPWTVTTKAGDPFKVFTPFWRACRAGPAPAAPKPAPRSRRLAGPWTKGDRLDDWALLPRRPDWAAGFAEAWQPGEGGARRRLAAFLKHRLAAYATQRDRPDRDGTARLSAHLHWGEIGPRQVWHAVQHRVADSPGRGLAESAEVFLSELGWREFSYHLLFHNPTLPEANARGEFDAFPWRDDADALRAWRRGATGYPLVDAGMRQLWTAGWMHNRVRMIVASFLTKHLLMHWRAGEAWFWDTLVDADLASNVAGWQWVAGSGSDAAPYFRIFNPILQSRKFDPEGRYLRRWVPEIGRLSDDHLHCPWAAPQEALDAAGVRLGETYPQPIVDHAAARERALAAYREMRAD